MTTNPYAEAVEAAARAIYEFDGMRWKHAGPAARHTATKRAEAGMAAAVGPLLAPLRALADDLASQETETGDPDMDDAYQSADRDAAQRIREALDAIEAGATSEGDRIETREDR